MISPSKEHLVFEFYLRFADDFIERSAAVVADSSRLEMRLIGVIETQQGFHRRPLPRLRRLFATAASPARPVYLFSADFTGMRTEAIDLFARVVDGCTPRVPDDLAAELPFLLWAFSLAMMYNWMHDHSEGQEQTRASSASRPGSCSACLVRMSSSPCAHFWRQLLSITRVESGHASPSPPRPVRRAAQPTVSEISAVPDPEER